MTDYYPLITKMLSGFTRPTSAEREEVYRRARQTLADTLGQRTPPMSKVLAEMEKGALELACTRIESEARRLESRQLQPFPTLFKTLPSRPLGKAIPSVLSQVVVDTGDKAEADKQEKHMSKADDLNRILRKLQSDSPGLEACAVISEDGLPLASVLTPDLDEARIGGMTAVLLNLGTRAAVELNRGGVKEVIIRGENGYAVMMDTGRGTLLLALANETAKLGLIFYDMAEAIRSLRKVLL